MNNRYIRIWLCVCIMMTLGCMMRYSNNASSENLVTIVYLSFEFVPIPTQLNIRSDFAIEIESPSRKTRLKRSSQTELEGILNITEKDVFQDELKRLSTAHQNDSECECVIFKTKKGDYQVTLEKQSKILNDLFIQIDEIFKRKFGRSYRIQLARPVKAME